MIDYNKISKFETLENLFYLSQLKTGLMDNINKFNFFEPTAHLRKFLILNGIYNNSKISQNKLAGKVKIVPAMVNKYISNLKKENIINCFGKNNKTMTYELTEKGINLLNEYFFNFMQEILMLYKEIKIEINNKLNFIVENKKIVLYGANEIAELILQIKQELKFFITNIIDSDTNKQDNMFYDLKIESPELLNQMEFDLIIITSLKNENFIRNTIKSKGISDNKIISFAYLKN